MSAPERVVKVSILITETELRALSFALVNAMEGCHTEHMRGLLVSLQSKIFGPRTKDRV